MYASTGVRSMAVILLLFLLFVVIPILCWAFFKHLSGLFMYGSHVSESLCRQLDFT